jgi:DNA invertase Pin-like site-specific DNA recombinase
MRREARDWLHDRRPALYVRESTKRQGKDDRFGPEIQRHAQREAIERFGMREPVRTYTDLVSGTNVLRRSDFRLMVGDARAKAFDVLLVYDVSRFARNETDAWVYLDALRDAGVAVYFCDPDILTMVDDDWRDQVGAEINAAAAYSRRLSRNITRALERKWAAGAQGGRPPFGYRRIDKAYLEPNEDAPIRALVFELYATATFTFEQLVDELNSRGHTMSGGPFTRSALRDILTNPVVIGTLRRNPRLRRETPTEARENAVAPIVDRDTWDRVQRILEERGRHRRSKRSDVYVFSGAARCSACGSRFWGHNAGSGQYRYRRLEHRPGGCGGVHHEKLLIEAFGGFLAGWKLQADVRARVARYLARGVEDLGVQRRKQLEGELSRLADLYRWQHVARDEYLAQRRELERRIAAIPGPARPPSDDAIALVDKLGDVWMKATDAERRRIVDEWVEELRLGRDRSIEILMRAPYRELAFAAYGQGHRKEPSQSRQYVVVLAGYDEWLAFWADEASA